MLDIQTDKEGYLINLNDWSESLMFKLAESEGIGLSEDHLEIILLLRQFYEEFDTSPTMRVFIKYMGQRLSEDKGTSIYLMSLFPGSPLKTIAKLAGLPKPTNCL